MADYNIDDLNARFMNNEDRRQGRIPFISEMAGTGEMLEATPQAMSKAMQGVAGGVAAGSTETARLIERGGRVVGKTALQGQQNIIQTLGALANTVGLDTIGNAIETLYGSEQNKTAMDALLQAYNEETTLPTYDDVKAYLQEKGLSFDDKGGELVGSLIGL